MDISNLCEDCLYKYSCPVNGHSGNAACLTTRKTEDEIRGLNIDTTTKDAKFDTTSNIVTDEAVFASLWALKKYCANHECDETCVLYEHDCKMTWYESPEDFDLREDMIKKTIIWKD